MDLNTKLVTVSGEQLDDATLRSAIEETGYSARGGRCVRRTGSIRPGSAETDPRGAEALGMSGEEMGMQHDASVLRDADTDDVDAMFASMMIDHHRGAVAIAELAQWRSRRDEIRQLADDQRRRSARSA